MILPDNQSVLIIGAGVVGYTTAMALAQRGYRVSLLDQGMATMESSWAGAGILSPLLPWDYGDAVNALCRLGARRHDNLCRQLLEDTGIDPEHVRCGMTILPPHGDVPAHAAALAEEGRRRLADVAQLRNPRLLHALRVRLDQLKVPVLENAPVTDFRITAHAVTAVGTPRGPVEAARFVVCTGAWTQKLLGGLGAGLDIRPIRGQMLLFKGKPGALDTILYRDGIYLVPRKDGHVLVGSTLEDVGFNKSTTREAHEMLYRNALAMFPVIAGMRLERQWAGLRPGTKDNIPVISRHPAIENLWVNAGHFRYGVTMAPASAEILAALITGNPPPIPAEPYAWPRRPTEDH